MSDKILPFFVPLWVGDTLALPPGLTWGETEVIEDKDGFSVRGRELKGDTHTATTLLKEADIEVCGWSLSKERSLMIMSREPTTEAILITHETKADGEKADSEASPAILADMQAALCHFSAYIGLLPLLHFKRGPTCEPIPVGTGDAVHFILGASPPGDVHSVDRTMCCGVLLHKGMYVKCNGPSTGRGVLIEDGESGPIAQVLDTSIYMFLPKINRDLIMTLSKAGSNLFVKLLGAVSKSYAEGLKEPECSRIDSPESFGTALAAQWKDTVDLYQQCIDHQDREAGNALERYRESLRHRRHFVERKGTAERLLAEKLAGSATSDYERLCSHPLVVEIASIKDALLIRTRRIIAEYDGKHYDLGEYMLKINLATGISIWSTAPTHPQGVAHPHISRRSSLCFGNVGPEISLAVVELRYADAVELALEWLSSGYDAKLADVKIEEWPLVQEAA